MTARRLIPYQWCWRCGRAVPHGFVCRRVVQTGSSHSTSYGTTLHVTNTAYYHPVSLCPRCDEEITEEERARLEASAARWAWWWRLGLGTWLVIGLTVAPRIPLPLSLAIAWGLARIGVLGRAVLTLHAVAVLSDALGWPPERHTPQVMAVWGTITGALAAWKYRYTITSWFGLRRKTIENDAAGRPKSAVRTALGRSLW